MANSLTVSAFVVVGAVITIIFVTIWSSLPVLLAKYAKLTSFNEKDSLLSLLSWSFHLLFIAKHLILFFFMIYSLSVSSSLAWPVFCSSQPEELCVVSWHLCEANFGSSPPCDCWLIWSPPCDCFDLIPPNILSIQNRSLKLVKTVNICEWFVAWASPRATCPESVDELNKTKSTIMNKNQLEVKLIPHSYIRIFIYTYITYLFISFYIDR